MRKSSLKLLTAVTILLVVALYSEVEERGRAVKLLQHVFQVGEESLRHISSKLERKIHECAEKVMRQA